ncbi:MAG: hypothetical protein JO272_13610 [Pseudonocardiales bacterium]|nr:hypothetical protein [Pseudonocardiales bacterium]
MPLTQAQRLAQDAAAAAELRAYQTHPDVVALRVDRIRTQVEVLMWTGIVLGLCFTMTTVQHFAATGAPVGSLAWWAAWWLDPMVSLVLLAVLRAEQLTTRHQVSTGAWPHIAKWVLLTATYVMNTWSFWAAGSASGVVLHSVPPLVVVIAAEALTDLQYALSDCAQAAAGQHGEPPVSAAVVNPSADTPPALVGTVGEHRITLPEHPHPLDGERPANRPRRGGAASGEHRSLSPASVPRRGSNPRKPSAGGRKLLADYLAEARAAYQPGVVITPAWVRQVTGCSRGLSPRLTAALTAELTTTPGTTPTEVVVSSGTTPTDREGRAS